MGTNGAFSLYVAFIDSQFYAPKSEVLMRLLLGFSLEPECVCSTAIRFPTSGHLAGQNLNSILKNCSLLPVCF